jgi:hypothetical protein
MNQDAAFVGEPFSDDDVDKFGFLGYHCLKMTEFSKEEAPVSKGNAERSRWDKDESLSKSLQQESPLASLPENLVSIDLATIPKRLDAIFERFDKDGAVRATVLKVKRQQNLVSKLQEGILGEDECRSEMNKAFDLLDALSRSGSLPLSFSELRVVVAATDCFENDVMGTVIQDNINPIEKIERSAFIVASTIRSVSFPSLLSNEKHLYRLASSFLGLIELCSVS